MLGIVLNDSDLSMQVVPVTILSAFSFQRLRSTFRRTDRASTAPVSKPMMCSSLPNFSARSQRASGHRAS